MSTNIRHRGRVQKIQGTCVSVSILQVSACATCEAAQLCRSSESKEKVVDVQCADAAALTVGQEVTLVGSTGMGMKAVYLAYVIPLVLIMAAMGAANALQQSMGRQALAALCVVAAWYWALYAMRGKLNNKFSFKIQLN